MIGFQRHYPFLDHSSGEQVHTDRNCACATQSPIVLPPDSTTGELRVLEQIGRLDFSCIPEGHHARRAFAVSVEWRRPDRYAVTRDGDCADASGEWSYESMPSNRRDEWVAEHLFDLATARALALKLAPLVVSMGRTAAQVLQAFPVADE